ncbi:hypothetical protein E6C27_scaffold40G001610 [Cucumis melo var. makuwa]|uniref:Ty3-gypsy retrotransposon protein n=1 Tax=Cucumis melo var. makuwa TaxID=1194695 RepID=A0A5A7VIC2_CUCMM|nr:hypothetical protein E6C27_scaffold40G001610 [Cucumis melo var. makuwa]
MKENDHCVGELKEEPGMGSKGTSSIEGVKNFNEFKNLSNDLESHKEVEDVAEVNEEIKINIAKDDEQLAGVTLEKLKAGTLCKLAFETKERVIAWGTIFYLKVEGHNVKVAGDVVVDGDCAVPIPTKKGIYKMSQEVDGVGEFTKDMVTFPPTPVQTAPVALRCNRGLTLKFTVPRQVNLEIAFLSLGKGFPTTGPRIKAGNVVIHRGLHCTLRICASFGSTRLICASFGSTRLICASLGITRLIGVSFGITRLIRASSGITRLICAFYGTTKLLCRVRVQRGADRREAGRMREGHMDASGFLYASADIFC